MPVTLHQCAAPYEKPSSCSPKHWAELLADEARQVFGARADLLQGKLLNADMDGLSAQWSQALVHVFVQASRQAEHEVKVRPNTQGHLNAS